MDKLSEGILETLFRNASDGIIILDREGTILDANRRACEMHGFAEGELVGMSGEELVTTRDRHFLRERMERMLKGEALLFETDHLRQDKSPFTVEVSAKAIEVAGRTVIYALHRDVTDKKKLKAHLLHFQKMESLGTLAERIAHEFKNALTVIVGFAELILQDEQLDPATAKYARIIEESARKTTLTVSHLLSFARMDDFMPVPLDINMIVRDTIMLVSKFLHEKIVVREELQESVPCIVGDLGQIEQVLMNLMINAKDAMPEGGDLIVRTSIVDMRPGIPDIPAKVRNGRYVNVVIADTGCGISEEHLPHIFKPFYTTKEKGKGTGLGLAIVYSTIKEHGGYVTVRSETGRGSEFNIYLPLSREKIVTVEDRQTVQFKAPETILVIDDETSVMELIREALLMGGYNVVIYDDPFKGLEYFKENMEAIDLVVSDVSMRGLDGRRLIGNLREIAPEVKIIMMTGLDMEQDKHAVNGLLRKPFGVAELLSIVKNVLDKSEPK